MENASYLTPGHNPTLAAQIAKTWPGQAHCAGSGPLGETCASCEHLGYERQIRGPKMKTRRHSGCAKFLALTGRHGPVVPASYEACRHFTPRNDNALGE